VEGVLGVAQGLLFVGLGIVLGSVRAPATHVAEAVAAGGGGGLALALDGPAVGSRGVGLLVDGDVALDQRARGGDAEDVSVRGCGGVLGLLIFHTISITYNGGKVNPLAPGAY